VDQGSRPTGAPLISFCRHVQAVASTKSTIVIRMACSAPALAALAGASARDHLSAVAIEILRAKRSHPALQVNATIWPGQP